MISGGISISSAFPTKGIYYIGQYGTSGYATAARGYLYHYFSLKFPITYHPLYFDNSELSDDDPYNIVVKSLIGKKIDYFDTVIMHSTPDLWPQFRQDYHSIINNKIVIGYCTWETNKLPQEWVDCINNTVNEIWVPSKYNEKTFKDSGVNKLIRVVPHIFLHKSIPAKENVKIVDENKNPINLSNSYIFYSIGELNERKGTLDLIDVFGKTFGDRDDVKLILKVHYKDYSDENKTQCKMIIFNKIKEYKNASNIICLFDNLSSDEITGIHSIGNCYVSLTKSEGFGLTIFDAFNYKKDIIVTGYGGHLDFLGENYKGLVKYTIGAVNNMESPNYKSDQLWAIPNLTHAGDLMWKKSLF